MRISAEINTISVSTEIPPPKRVMVACTTRIPCVVGVDGAVRFAVRHVVHARVHVGCRVRVHGVRVAVDRFGFARGDRHHPVTPGRRRRPERRLLDSLRAGTVVRGRVFRVDGGQPPVAHDGIGRRTVHGDQRDGERRGRTGRHARAVGRVGLNRRGHGAVPGLRPIARAFETRGGDGFRPRLRGRHRRRLRYGRRVRRVVHAARR